MQVLPKLLDVQVSGAIGSGIGRYATAQLPDITVSSTGQIKPLPEIAPLVGATVYATPSIDVYAYAGEEQVSRESFGSFTGVNYGNGNPAISDAGCNLEGSTICAGTNSNANTRQVRQFTVGAWDTFNNGRFGQSRGSAQSSFTEKTLFSSNTGGAPSADENIVLTSLRCYPF